MGQSSRIRAMAVATVLLASAKAQSQFQGCVGIDSAFGDTQALNPNGPPACEKYCTDAGYPYFALSAQFCSCSRTAPNIWKRFPNSDCTFMCDAPYQNEFCGGIDQPTLSFIYDLYFAPSLGAVVVTPTATGATSATTTRLAGASSTSSAAPADLSIAATLTPVANPSTTSVPRPTNPIPAPAGLIDPAAASAAISTFRTAAAAYLSTVTVTVTTTSIFTCSDGALETAALPTVQVLVYDPSQSTVITVTREGLAVVTVTALPTAAASSAPYLNDTQNGTTAPLAPTARVLSGGAAESRDGGTVVAWGAAVFGFLVMII